MGNKKSGEFDDDSGSCVTEEEIVEIEEEENRVMLMKGQSLEKIVSFLVEEHEKDVAFNKNPYICEQAVDHYYYLLPRAKRSKGLRKRIKIQSFKKNSMPFEFESSEKFSLKRKRIATVDSKCEERKVRRKFKIEPIESSTTLPDTLKMKIQEKGVEVSEVSLVIEKKLYPTDLSSKHMRLSIPMNQVRNTDFLTPQQKMDLETKDERNRNLKIRFNLIEPSLEETRIHMAKWDMNKTSNYVLLNDWLKVVERNKLTPGTIVQLWSFNHDLDSWLALVVVSKPEADVDL